MTQQVCMCLLCFNPMNWKSEAASLDMVYNKFNSELLAQNLSSKKESTCLTCRQVNFVHMKLKHNIKDIYIPSFILYFNYQNT